MHSTTSTAVSSTGNRQRRPTHRPQVQRHTPRPLPLLEAIEGLSQGLNALQASLGSAHTSQSGGHAWPQRQAQPQAIAMPWLSDAQVDQSSELSQAHDPESREPREDDWESDLWSCPWDELSVVELRSLLRCYPIDRRQLPAPIENLRRSELIEALSELQEVTA